MLDIGLQERLHSDPSEIVPCVERPSWTPCLDHLEFIESAVLGMRGRLAARRWLLRLPTLIEDRGVQNAGLNRRAALYALGSGCCNERGDLS